MASPWLRIAGKVYTTLFPPPVGISVTVSFLVILTELIPVGPLEKNHIPYKHLSKDNSLLWGSVIAFTITADVWLVGNSGVGEIVAGVF